MSDLIKPSEYAKRMGISRQAVYAKIKKGILTSKSVDGKLYIVQDQGDTPAGNTGTDNPASRSDNPSASRRSSSGMQEVLAAKEETISVLKETIRDLKETNQMITSTLRSEVELLKEAFSEMKLLYSAQIEQLQIAEQPHEVEEEIAQDVMEEDASEEEALFPELEQESDDLAWIELADFFDEHGVRKKKKREKIAKRFRKLFQKGDSRVDSFNGELIVLANADYTDILKKRS